MLAGKVENSVDLGEHDSDKSSKGFKERSMLSYYPPIYIFLFTFILREDAGRM